MIKTLENEKTKCLFTCSDGSTTGDYIRHELSSKFPHVTHLNYFIHLVKNARNRLLSNYISVKDGEPDIKFCIRNFIDLFFEIERNEAEQCEIPLESLHPKDKMAVSPVLALLEDDVIKSCQSSKSPEINQLGVFLLKTKKFYKLFDKDAENSEIEEDLKELKNYFCSLTGLDKTGQQLLATIKGLQKISELCPEFPLSLMSTNSIENFFSIMKGKVLYPNSLEYLRLCGRAWTVTKILQDQKRGFTLKDGFISKHYDLAEFSDSENAFFFIYNPFSRKGTNKKEQNVKLCQEQIDLLKEYAPKPKTLSIRDKETKKNITLLVPCPYIVDGCKHFVD